MSHLQLKFYLKKLQIKRYAMIALGCLISAGAINLFLVPHKMLSGGLSGIAMILYFMVGTPIGIMVSIMNIPLLYMAYKHLPKEFFWRTLYGIILFSLCLDATRFLTDFCPTKDIFLSSIYAGALGGVGGGMVFRAGGSTGGTDIVAAIVKKIYSMEIGTVGFGVNVVIVSIGMFLLGVEQGMYTLFSMFVGAQVTDKVVEGFNRKKTILLISDKYEEISARILDEIHRGVTFIQAEGGYSKDNKKIMMVVVTLVQISQVKYIVETTDPNSFMIILDAADVEGKGFSLPSSRTA